MRRIGSTVVISKGNAALTEEAPQAAESMVTTDDYIVVVDTKCAWDAAQMN